MVAGSNEQSTFLFDYIFTWYWKLVLKTNPLPPSVSYSLKSSTFSIYWKFFSWIPVVLFCVCACSVQFCSWKPSGSWRRPWSRVSSGCSPASRRVCSPTSRRRPRFPPTPSTPPTRTSLPVSKLPNPIPRSAQPLVWNDLGTRFSALAFRFAVHF